MKIFRKSLYRRAGGVIAVIAAIAALFAGCHPVAFAAEPSRLPSLAESTVAEPIVAARAGVVSLRCAAFYLPARSIWQRTVDIELDASGVRAVQIDGVAVYTFNINGAQILTAVDGERIQIDTEALTWSSDLRGLVSSRGSCSR